MARKKHKRRTSRRGNLRSHPTVLKGTTDQRGSETVVNSETTSDNDVQTKLKLRTTRPSVIRGESTKTLMSYLQSLLLKRFGRILLLAVISIICIAAFMYLRQSTSVTIKSSLTDVKDIELKFSDYQSQGYSPVCGCFGEQRPENWRGISFATRHLTIERTGRLPTTAYMLTVAAPRQITWSSPGERFSADLYFISLPSREVFVPKNILENSTPATYQILEKRHFDPRRYFMIFSEEALNVDLLGDKPLGAWVPSDAAKVKIAYSRGMFPSSKTSATISEDYSIQETGSPLQEIVGVPLGDFLGPKIVVWSNDDKLNIMAGKDIINPPAPLKNSQIVTALVAHPPFSLRIACIPEDADVVSIYRQVLASKPVQHSDVDYLQMVRHPEDEQGVVNILIPDIEEGAAQFAAVYKKMKENDIVRVPNVPGDFIVKDYDTGKEIGKYKTVPWMEFRYPPIPPNPGFNVFGSFSAINFRDIKGHILVGSRVHEINVPSDLELRDINSLEIDGGVIKVPIRWDSKGSLVDIQLQATAQARLNGEPLTSRFDAYRQYFEYVLLISAILSAVGAVFQTLIARRIWIPKKKR